MFLTTNITLVNNFFQIFQTYFMWKAVYVVILIAVGPKTSKFYSTGAYMVVQTSQIIWIENGNP